MPAPLETPARDITPDAPARDITIDTKVVEAVLSTRGAHLRHWRLKKYSDNAGQRVDLVPQNLPAGAARPFMLRVEDQAVSERLNTAGFERSGPGRDRIDATRAPTTVTFDFADASGLRARKTFVFTPESYVIQFSADVRLDDRQLNPAVVWGPGLGDTTVVNRYLQAAEGIVHRAGRVERLDTGDLAQQPAQEGPFRYGGVDDHYFLAAIVGPQVPARLEYEAVTPAAPSGETAATLVGYTARFAQPPSAAQFFFGPKDFDVLQAADTELVRVINFGIFSWLAVPLLKALKWIDQYVGNYGWSIIILTVLINVAMFPLRHKSVVSMRRMQELQPEVKAIQDRYAKLKSTDPETQKMRVELMNLYRERGVNPASGCIPMVLTMPVLFAFYALLSQAIEIRGAPFVWWIKDLSVGDPLYIWPIFMGVTMLVQQRMTPATGTDPMQQKMMMMMPIMFTVMGLWMPSGLVIYWSASNVLAIAQQVATNRLIGPTKVKTVRPAAERRVKQAGSGRTDAAARADDSGGGGTARR
ncbi:MAG: membrane protein insertase YidC [Acidobacteria bacterium]|nr:membrane protein insertase YidC [Acidobacteriota bacterium]